MPGAVFKDRDLAVLTGPCPGGPCPDDVAAALNGRIRRGGLIKGGNAQLHQRIQTAQRLVMGNMLLRLRRLQIR